MITLPPQYFKVIPGYYMVQSSMWSLTEVDKVPFKCLPVWGDISLVLWDPDFHMPKGFTNIWSIVAYKFGKNEEVQEQHL